MRFSQRIGKSPKETPIQFESMSLELRNSLWNAVYVSHFITMEKGGGWLDEGVGLIAQMAQAHFFKAPLDELPKYGFEYFDSLKRWFFNAEWTGVYDFVDWLANYGNGWDSWREGDQSFDNARSFREHVNHILERENSAYRFVDAALAPISNNSELKEIESALSHGGKFSAVTTHIDAALSLLSDRTNPDYRNSIKESISAVEAAAKLVTGDRKATLGDALKALEAETNLHGALKEGFSKLYGWTSNADGIRHAMMEGASLTVSDARFMLVTCSAFANYLIERTSAD